jgi:hypothetical protein
MSPLSRNRTPARWPFWLLIAAWACANSPQIAICAVLTWAGEARHFTHQQRLTAEVAHVLSGQSMPSLLATMKEAPSRPLAPVMPAEAALKKIELALERTTEVLPPDSGQKAHFSRVTSLPDSRREAPPHEPPRASVLVA